MAKDRLHILFLCGWYPSRVLPTNGDFIQRHAEAVNTIHKVSVIHIISDPTTKQNIEIVNQIINGVDTHIAYLKPTTNKFIKAVRYFTAFKKLIKKIDHYDLVHLNILYPFGIIAIYLKLFHRKKFIITEHWSDYQYPLNKHIGFIEHQASKIISKKACYIAPVTKHLAQHMQNFGLKGRYKSVPNVVTTQKFKPILITNAKPTFIHISNLEDSIKNISGILKTLEKLKEHTTDFIFYFIGGKNSFGEKYEHDQNIIFIDFLPHEELVTYLQRSDLFVLFSNYENLPCVILEAFSCGVPVVSTEVGGIKEYFPENFGRLIGLKDQEALLDILLNFNNIEWANKESMNQYTEDNFGKSTIAKAFDKLYQSCID